MVEDVVTHACSHMQARTHGVTWTHTHTHFLIDFHTFRHTHARAHACTLAAAVGIADAIGV